MPLTLAFKGACTILRFILHYCKLSSNCEFSKLCSDSEVSVWKGLKCRVSWEHITLMITQAMAALTVGSNPACRAKARLG